MTTIDKSPIVITRSFDAPRDLVWKAWTEKEHLVKWFAPPGMRMLTADMDFRDGGSFHYSLTGPYGEMWGLWRFVKIDAPERIELMQSFSDPDRGITNHPMDPNWPLTIHSVTTLEEKDGKTVLTIRWLPVEGTSETEWASFEAGRAHVPAGWEGTFAPLDAYLAEIRK